MSALNAPTIFYVNRFWKNVEEVDNVDLAVEDSEVWKTALEIYDVRANLVVIRSIVMRMDQFYIAEDTKDIPSFFSTPPTPGVQGMGWRRGWLTIRR